MESIFGYRCDQDGKERGEEMRIGDGEKQDAESLD